MIFHTLKTQPGPFRAVVTGRKRFEFRKDDRPTRFQVGDVLCLLEYDPDKGLTGERWYVKVTYVLRDTDGFGVPLGFSVLSILDSALDQDHLRHAHGEAEPIT